MPTLTPAQIWNELTDCAICIPACPYTRAYLKRSDPQSPSPTCPGG